MIPFKALRKNPFKSFLVFSSITIAIMAIFLISSISQGLIGMYAKMIKSDGDIIITQKGIADTFFSNINRKIMTQSLALSQVSSAYAMIVGASPVGKIPIAGIYGVSENRLSHYTLLSGSYPETGEVLLGQALADQIDAPSIKIGNRSFTVTGSYRSDIGFEAGGVVMGIEDAGKLFSRSASFIIVSVSNPHETDSTIEAIRKMDNDIEVKTTQSFVQEYNQFKIIENSSLVISLLAFFMGLMGISSVMTMIVSSRKEEFGILRALGKSRMFIIQNIFMETVIITLSAYLFALGMSAAILAILPHVQTLQGYVSGSLELGMALYVLASSIAMALLGALFPAWSASKTDPVLLINQGCS